MGSSPFKDVKSIENKDGETIITEKEWITRVKQMNIPKDLKKFKTLRLPDAFETNTGYMYSRKRREIKVPDGRGFVLEDLLDGGECSFFVHQLEDEIGFEDMSEKYPPEYRSNDRVKFL